IKMKELLEHIVKSIVNHPEDVSIEEKESVDFPGLTILTINVNEEDKGVIIGRKGRTINSIRDIITISAIRNNKRVRVILKDDNKPNREENQEDMLNDEV
ncbi:MAG TPA: KH domain-containing protein, partial [Candidatus Dojkabacteria bacterium]|nr:KH domain-containing protein [Candidatus Dojkabacteria bacterium]